MLTRSRDPGPGEPVPVDPRPTPSDPDAPGRPPEPIDFTRRRRARKLARIARRTQGRAGTPTGSGAVAPRRRAGAPVALYLAPPRPRHDRPHLGRAMRSVVIAVIAGLCGTALSAAWITWPAAVLVGWDVAVAVYCLDIWRSVLPMDAAAARTYALRDEPGLALRDAILLAASVGSLGGVGLILAKAAAAAGGTKAGLIAIGVVTVIASWTAVHTTFALRYAQLYYRAPEGGIDFHGDGPPNFVDFAYMAFTVGMTFQVSDTEVTARTLRRATLRHSLLSYLFGAVIVGLVINVVASLLR
jgi:uncharacterized membrane protein